MSAASDRAVRLATAIRERRQSMAPRKSQEEVAHDAGVSVRHYQKIEGGQGDPKISTLLGIADALGVKLQKLLDLADAAHVQRARKR